MPKQNGPLDGLRILDLSRILAGPVATQILGDYGADVIKVERPGHGDDTRKWGPPFLRDDTGTETSESAYYLCVNRNKRSVALDISSPEGAAQVRELLRHCDVLVENFKRGGLAKYGLSYEDLKSEFPGLIYCSITGFGQTGPNADKPGYDLLAQAYGGLMSLTGPADGEPTKVAVGIADVLTGLYATTAVLAALRHRDRTGEGQHIDLALVDCQVAALVNEGSNFLLTGEAPQRRGNQHPNIVPYQVFAVADGHVIVAVGNDAQYQRFCDLIGMPQLATDPRFVTNAGRLEYREALLSILEERLQSFERDSLIAGMEARSIPGGPINTVPDLFASEQAAAREMQISMPHTLAASGSVDLVGSPVKFSKTPVSYRHAPPTCGQHTDEVLAELIDAAAQKRAG